MNIATKTLIALGLKFAYLNESKTNVIKVMIKKDEDHPSNA